MHVAVDLNWFPQFVALALAAAFGFLYLVRNTASRYFVVNSNFASTSVDFSSNRTGRASMAPAAGGGTEVSDACAECGRQTTKQCARCKMVKYCSEACQSTHWKNEHKSKCKDMQSLNKLTFASKERKASLVPASGSSRIYKKPNKILFPYEEFVRYFDWDKPDYPRPCGLLNCGNSCFANVVLQCLSYTRPLVAYLLEKGHKKECQMDKWCFFCEFQTHVERATQSVAPFSPMNILARLRNIGGNLGYGQQEDAHELMRFAIDTMQSVCLDEFGGEKAVHPTYQLTTLIQHIFGGRLQSQVVCTECNNVSNQFENMMDLTVEIHGDAETLEECLDQYTAKERLHGDNMYKCDCCNTYVMAWKRLSVQQAPNILTIALKRFQSGRFGKLNKRVTFPEKLNLRSYMSELEDGNDYMLYAVIVHLDMLNASFFGHYICYVKDFRGNWYKIDDCEVVRVDLEEVHSQGAYMLLYKRIRARPSCLLPIESLKEENENGKIQAVDPLVKQPIECLTAAGSLDNPIDSGHLFSANCSSALINTVESSITNTDGVRREVKVESSGEVHNMEVDPEENGSPLNHNIRAIPPGASLSENSSMELDANNYVPSSVSDIDDESLENKSHVIAKTEAAESCKSEEGNKSDVSLITTNEVRELNSANVTSSLDIAECRNGAPLPNKNVKKCSNGGASGTKLKPVFPPGFLGNGRHSRENLKQKNKVVALEAGEKMRKPNKVGNDEEKPCIVPENGRLPTDSPANKSLGSGDLSHPSNCSQCKHQNSHNKNNACSSRAAKPCC